MTAYLATTFPSDYDTSADWCCTIGRYEHEVEAHAIVAYLQEHGDEWAPVPREAVVLHAPMAESRDLVMTEEWLARLQRVRRPRQGPPALVRDRGVLQLKWPNGDRVAVSHFAGMMSLEETP